MDLPNLCTGATAKNFRVLQIDAVASRDQQYQTAGLLKEGEDVELHTKLVDPSLGL